jgi:predicted amino acid-binding ACT domain protein
VILPLLLTVATFLLVLRYRSFFTYFAENSINILDIAQTTLRGIINMVMIVDIGPSKLGFEEVTDTIRAVSKDVRCIINVVRDADLDSF